MTTQRLFVAIDLPDAAKTQLMRLRAEIDSAKWVDVEQMHLTLRFVGDASPEQTKQLETGLAAIQAAPFSFRLQGVGQFPTHDKPRVLWVGLPHSPELHHLQAQVEQVVSHCGFERADHPFSPHITLARFRTPPPPVAVEEYFRLHNHFKTGNIVVNAFILYSSTLTPKGSVYTQVARFPLI